MRRARLGLFVAMSLGVALAAPHIAAALPDVPSSAFMPVSGCGCHSGLLEDWQVSMHAKALEDPIYQYKLDEANRATDGAIGAYCDSCHGPVATMSGEIADLANATQQSKEAVMCDFCHQVTGTNSPLGNVSQTLNPDGTKRAQFADSVSPFHETAYSGFHETAEFCGACHNVDHPANGMHLEATFTEWQEGPYAAEGIKCQDCHMTPGPGVTKPYPGTAAGGGVQREHIYLMTFAGGNVALGDSVRAEERLKAAATLDLEVPEIVGPGESAEITTKITNVGAGHYLPTGLTEVRQMWLEVKAIYPDGAEEVLGTHEFGTILKDAEGNSPVELWDAVAFASDDRIPPRESVSDTFEFSMPTDGQAEIQAALYYRSCSEEMAEGAGVDVPTTTMVSANQGVYGDEAIRAAARAVEDDGDAGANGMQLGIALGGIAVALGLIGFMVMRSRREKRTPTGE